MSDDGTWVVTTSGTRSVPDVVRDLRSAGFEVDQALDAIGVITGSGSGDVADAARRIPGVEDVSPDQAVDIGPPDNPLAW